jgi:tRNA/rRNA methyltransferase
MNQPVIILVQPQMGENIGAAARAMANCGLADMRLVNPRDGWPNERAVASSSGATDILDRAIVYPTTAAAVADLTYVLASTARPRDLAKPVVAPAEGVAGLQAQITAGNHAGILFGAERTGLLNEDLDLADAIITVPLNPAFTSLNLAQAVLLIGHEWFKQQEQPPLPEPAGRLATKAELLNMFEHLEEELDLSDYFKNPLMRPTMVGNLRAMLQRASLTEQEVRTLHGIIVALTGRSRRKG